MEPRSKKHKKQLKVPLNAILVTIGLLITIPGLLMMNFKNDTTVSVDFDSQETLDYAYKNEKNTSFNIPEVKFQEMMHEMTHQKVKSRLKYGSLELNRNNAIGLLNILKQNKYNHSDLYKEILNHWKNGDYSDIVKEHNEIWKLLNKPDGRAFGKMSKSDEENFIKEHFTSTE